MTTSRRNFLQMLAAAALTPVLGCASRLWGVSLQGVKYAQNDLSYLQALWQGSGLSSPLEMTLQDIENIDQQHGQNYRFRPHTLTYYCIKKAQMEGRLPRTGNVMIHIDSHRDFDLPQWEISQMLDVAALVDDDSLSQKEKREVLKRICVYPLHIENFMVPLLVDGSVSEVYHLKPPVEGMEFPCAPKVWRYYREGDYVTRVTLVEQEKKGDVNTLPVRFTEHWIEEPEATIKDLYETIKKQPWEKALLQNYFRGKSVILDIDYDYFGCMAEPLVHCHTPEEARQSVQKVLYNLALLGVRPKLICQAESPKYTPPELVPAVAQAVQDNLERYRLLPAFN